jgi:o-succinylbenzoate synthase
MRIRHSRFTPYRLPLRRQWLSHRESLGERRGWLIHLETESHHGIGDCAPLPSAGTETAAESEAWLRRYCDGFSGKDPATLPALLDAHPGVPPAVRCGLETALIDLLAKQQGTSIARQLNPDAAQAVAVNANLGALDAQSAQRIRQSRGYPVIKLKLGIAPLEQELPLLLQAAEGLPEGVSLRLDANRAWTTGETMQLLSACEALPIESIEEPLAAPELKTLRQLQQNTAIPLALDESLKALGFDAVLRSPPVRRVTLKPMVMGGLTPALAWAQRAHDAGMDAVVTTTVDSAIGVWAAVHLAAALGSRGEKLAHGVATSQWLSRDVAEPPAIVQGRITLQR